MVTHTGLNSNLNAKLAENLAAELGIVLKIRGFKLALAESCTGGMASQYITAIAGSSAWFDCGFVTYSNAAKKKMLGVSETALNQHGAVSEAVALEMALGALKNSGADIAASITGVAGPDGGTADKPVGTVCFAWALQNQPPLCSTKQFKGNRDEIRHQAVFVLMAGLLEILNNQD